MLTLGVHFTISKGFSYAAKTVLDMGGNTFQFFCRNPRGSQIKKYDEKDIDLFQNIRKESNMGPFLAHAPYTMNLASVKEELSQFSREAVKEDILRMEQLDIEYFNIHPGSHVNSNMEDGIERIIVNLNEAISGSSNIIILLETMSGKGNEVGFRFEQLKAIMDGIVQKDRIGICMDLCHMFSAGYDIVHDFEGVIKHFDDCIGLENLKTVHLNDSMFGLGERKDRHTPVGKGKIGMDATLNILAHPCMVSIPFYLETPLDDEGHREEISNIRKLSRREES